MKNLKTLLALAQTDLVKVIIDIVILSKAQLYNLTNLKT